MKFPHPSLFALLSLNLLGLSAPARAEEIIRLRTGQLAGAPAACPDFEDRFTYNAVNLPPACGQPLRAVPFTAADFAAADAGPVARVVNPFGGFWMAGLPADPLARWIAHEKNGTCNGDVGSILYSCSFTVTTPGAVSGDVSVCWGVDDRLGDPPGGPNPVGVYVNGVPLTGNFSGGDFFNQSCGTQLNVPLTTGVNHLYIYQRDTACTTSGVMATAVITVHAPPSGVGEVMEADRAGIVAVSAPGGATAALRVSLPRAGEVRLTLHDAQGRRVRTLLAGDTRAGVRQVTWDGRNDAGLPAPAGLYLARLEAPGALAACRVLLVH